MSKLNRAEGTFNDLYTQLIDWPQVCGTKILVMPSKALGWMACAFMSFSTVFQSYQDNDNERLCLCKLTTKFPENILDGIIVIWRT